MKFHLVIRPAAEADMAGAYRWYEKQRPGLGEEFLLAAEAIFAQLERNPRAFPPIHKQIHRALLRRFPYGVFFLIDGEKIAILAVMHVRRDPRAWKRRG